MVKLAWVILLGLCSLGLGQDARLELGFRGEMVVDHWNPLRLIRRDMGPATLTIEIDQGTLREGVIPVIYQVKLPSAQGLDVFEDDIYIPFWRSFVWKLADETQVFASGSFDRQSINTQSIDLIISKTPELYLESLGETQRIVQGDDLLPKRLAAYDGVHTLLLDGSLPIPSLEAISSAAASGVNVLWVEGLAQAYPHDMLSLLAPYPRQRLGAGWLIRTPLEGIGASLALLPELDATPLQNAVFSPQPMTRGAPVTTVLAALGTYALLVLLSIRFFGSAGLLTTFLLAAFAGLGFWNWLRVPAQKVYSQSLYLNAGKLAQVNRVYQITQLPQSKVALPLQARPVSTRPYTQGQKLDLELERWSQETLWLKPGLHTATLLLEGNILTNQSSNTMHNIYIKGLGQQKDLEAGQSLELVPGEETGLYETLLPLLPLGTVIARQNVDWHIALPSQEFAVQP